MSNIITEHGTAVLEVALKAVKQANSLEEAIETLQTLIDLRKNK
jgi:hypothetical protein